MREVIHFFCYAISFSSISLYLQVLVYRDKIRAECLSLPESAVGEKDHLNCESIRLSLKKKGIVATWLVDHFALSNGFTTDLIIEKNLFFENELLKQRKIEFDRLNGVFK